ncbi:hypothetical protein Tco_1212710 [Tanacetum coccineum]
MVPKAVLMKSGLVLVNTARQVNTAHLKTTVNAARPMSYLSKKAHSTVKRPFHMNTTFKNSNFNQRVNTVKDKNANTVRPKAVVNAARPKAVVNAVKGNNVNAVKASACWVWKPKTKVDDFKAHEWIHVLYLHDYEEIDGGYVAFGGNPKGGKITRKVQLQDLVDEKKIIITESTVRRDLQLEDAEGVDCLPNATIFEQLTLIGLDEAVYKELDDSLETPNESGSLETTSGGGPRCQETMGDTITQTRFENVSKLSNDPLLAREFLICKRQRPQQAKEIVSLKRRVKKLEQKKRSKTHGLKRLYKVGAIARVESSRDEESLGEDASKQGRINAIDADEDIALVNDQDDADIFDVNTLTGDEVLAELEVVVKYVNLTVNEVTLAQALAALKSVKPKVKANVVEEQVYQLVLPVQRLDEEIASKLQVEFDEEERLAWEKDEANVTLTEE